jgi:phosphatidate cytidylyltransferase
VIRLVSGIVLAGAALAAILFLPVLALRVLIAIVAALAAHEYLRVVGSDPRLFPAAAIVSWLLSGSLGITGVWLLVLLTFALVVGGVLFAGLDAGRAAAGAFSLVYIGFPLGLLVMVHAGLGWRATLLLIATVVVSDSMQYYTGRLLGRRPLAPTVSPKKTIEGAVGGVVFGSIFLIVAGPYVFAGVRALEFAVLGLIIVTLGIIGDLFESRLKRQAGMKDSSDLIPGHGGVLDRIDALLLAIPAFWVFAVLYGARP